jgi:hypothetical protein
MDEEKRIKKLIVLVGEFGESETEGNLRKLIGVTKESVVVHKQFIIQTLVECISKIP